MSTNHRSRRQTTACTSCRHRKVKCDRTRPSCLQCSQRKHLCEYIDIPASQIEFVLEPARTPSAVAKTPITPSETWKSVFESKIPLAGSAEGSVSLGGGVGGESRCSSSQTNKPPKLLSDKDSLLPIDLVVSIGSLGEPFLSYFQRSLAPEETYRAQFEHFLSTIHPLLPICHVPTLREAYLQFWERLSLDTSAELLVLILAILYTGGVNMTNLQDSQSCVNILGIYDTLVSALDLPTYHIRSATSSLWLLQGVVIMNTFKASRLPPFTAFGFLPFAVRFAQSLRSHAQHTEDAIETEAQRRLWSHLVYLDIESTIASGLSGIIHPDGQTLQLPKLDSSFPGGGETYSTPMEVAMQGHWQFAHRMHAWLERKPDQHEIVHLERLIQSLLPLVPDNPDNRWARWYLEILIDRAYCMVGLHSWQIDQFKGTGCESEVVRTSRSFLEKFALLSESSRYSGFAWFIPSLLQPIHALMILLMHLSHCTNPDKEELSRGLVDRVFDLRISHITSNSHRPFKRAPSSNQQYNWRYRSLNSMRARVWSKLNWSLALPHEAQNTPAIYPAGRNDVRHPPRESEDVKDLDLSELDDMRDLADPTIWNGSDVLVSDTLLESLDWDDRFLPS